MAKDLGEAGTDLQQICHLTEDFTDKHIFDILIWDAKADYAFLTSAALTLAPASVYICMLGQKSNHQLRKVEVARLADRMQVLACIPCHFFIPLCCINRMSRFGF